MDYDKTWWKSCFGDKNNFIFFLMLPCSQVVLQALFGLFVTLCGVVNIAGDFKDLDATAELRFKTFENMSNRPSFYSFNHRGKVLYAQPQEPLAHGATNILPITKLRRRQ
uniref:Uncharacterized protein n=1 Tax=Eptatretus burgeri TaxID=7764 RepID=A0A8C4QAI1_EPTBU